MNLTCPHCGKGLSISHDELVVCRGVVICPQCLAEFVAQGVDLPEPEALAQVDPKPAVLEVQPHAGERFCYSCGKELPLHEGLCYCPFCGTALLSNPQVSHVVEQAHKASPSLPAAAVQPTSHKSESMPKSKAASSNAYRYVPKVFSRELRPEPPGLRFKVIAYSIMALLVAIFGIIVYLGYQL